MLTPFFVLGMISPNRQRSFRTAVVTHLGLVSVLALILLQTPSALPTVGQLLLIAGIVEGAILVGWRLTQVPKSQALEFLLVSPVQPKGIYYGETAVGLTRLALITLTGLPIFILLAVAGRIMPEDVPVFVLMPLTWGAFTGLGLTAWAYESRAVRRWGEWISIAGVIVYLLIGVLAGENLRLWVTGLPDTLRWCVMEAFVQFHTVNPFAVMQYWLGADRLPDVAFSRMFGVELFGVGVVGLIALRGAARLRGHFHDRHYRPFTEVTPDKSSGVGDKPLSWWAVRRVMEYSGRVNMWLAGGFGLLYAAYTIAGDHWPSWLGKLVFQLVENMGGIPALAAGLAVLAAVPACFQYGLWDSSAQDRCRRLELLLLTGLSGRDYWDAAAAAAIRRGRGYFAIAIMLWLAAAIAGKATVPQVAGALAAAVIVWAFSFVLGFRAFARGRQANGLGSLLTLGLPLLTVGLAKAGWPALAALTPPGSVCYAFVGPPNLLWAIGPIGYGTAALVIGSSARHRCDHNLRTWYDKNAGRQMAE
jgi:hypothetical protein